ncbi:MAG: hypothetical protein AAF533_17615 [Acidobacteriota bacterium]
MNESKLGRLIQLADGLVQEGRRAHAACVQRGVQLERRRGETRQQRRLLLSGQPGLSGDSMAACLRVLDEREDRLRDEIAEAAEQEEAARHRVSQALTEREKLEELKNRVRDRRRRTQQRRATERVEALAASLRHRRIRADEEDRDGAWTSFI